MGQLEGHLHAFAADIHLDQRVSHQVSEATAVKVAVGPRVVPPVVDLRELQASVAVQLLPVEVLVRAADLQSQAGRLRWTSLERRRPFPPLTLLGPVLIAVAVLLWRAFRFWL